MIVQIAQEREICTLRTHLQSGRATSARPALALRGSSQAQQDGEAYLPSNGQGRWHAIQWGSVGESLRGGRHAARIYVQKTWTQVVGCPHGLDH